MEHRAPRVELVSGDFSGRERRKRMRKMQRNRGLWTLSATVLGMCVTASVASAAPQDMTTEQSGSVVVYPKVIWDGSRDTIIQIANTGNMPVSAHCFYVDSGIPG